MSSGYVLNFSDRTMSEFFRDDLKINIYDKKYSYASGSKANHMRGFWMAADNKTVGNSILKLIEYIRTQIVIDSLNRNDFPEDRVMAGKKIGEKLLSGKIESKESKAQATYKNGNITITLQREIFDHVQKLLNDGHYFTAVEEAYKVVRKKLEDITGEEKATDAFCSTNIVKIFGHQPKDAAKRDFFEGVKFLHMAIQFLRNEKAHTPAQDINKNLAIHYIALASLAYDLINRKYQ